MGNSDCTLISLGGEMASLLLFFLLGGGGGGGGGVGTLAGELPLCPSLDETLHDCSCEMLLMLLP